VKRYLILLLWIIAGLFHSGTAFSAIIYIDDSFTDKTKVELNRTTALVDTANGWVTLAKRNLANSMILYEDNYDITIINNDRVDTYRFNGSGMELVAGLSINGGLREPVSIAGRAGEYAVLDRGTKTVTWYHYDGTGMVPNGILSISLLEDPRALDVFPGTYDIALLDQSDLHWFSFDGTGLAPNGYLSFNPGGNPISLSLEKDGFACVLLDKASNQVRHYYFDGSKMVLDVAKSIQGPGELTNPKSLSVSKDGGLYLIVDDTEVRAYNYDGSGMFYNPYLSSTGFSNPLAVAIKPGSYDYAVLDENAGHPKVRYFTFTGYSAEEITALGVDGLEGIGYGSSQILWGKAFQAGHEVSGLKLLATVEVPEGTSISWEVTVDGLTWKPIVPGGEAVRFAIPGTQPNYRAVLQTNDMNLTPKILDVQLLDASLSLAAYAEKGGYKAGEAMVLYADTQGGAESVEAIMWWSGGNGFTADTTAELVPGSPISSDLNTWCTRHNYPADYERVVIIPRDMPDGRYTVRLRARKGILEAEDTIEIEVTGSQFNRIVSQLKDQRYLPYD